MMFLKYEEILRVLGDLEKEYIQKYKDSSEKVDKRYYLHAKMAISKAKLKIREYTINKYK